MSRIFHVSKLWYLSGIAKKQLCNNGFLNGCTVQIIPCFSTYTYIIFSWQCRTQLLRRGIPERVPPHGDIINNYWNAWEKAQTTALCPLSKPTYLIDFSIISKDSVMWLLLGTFFLCFYQKEKIYQSLIFDHARVCLSLYIHDHITVYWLWCFEDFLRMISISNIVK